MCLKEILAFCALALVCSSATFHDSAFRVINGMNIDEISSAPAVVLLEIEDRHIKYLCGGAVIGPKVVVTAGHCAGEYRWQIIVKSGSTERGKLYDNEVVAVFKHPLYRQNRFGAIDNDIAVIFTKKVIKGARRIALASSEPYQGEEALLFGWGVGNIVNRPIPRKLQMATVEIVNRETCLQVADSLNIVITDNNICAKPKFGHGSTCHGDSGSPLVINGLLVGLVSGGSANCGLDGMFGVYTNVPSYRNWIFNVTRGYL